MVIGELMQFGSIAELAARIVALIAVVYFAVFLQSLWVPKAAALGQASNAQRAQKKKKGKKNKKARGAAATKSAPDAEAVSEEELEVAQVQSSSDVEAPSMPSPRGASQETTLDNSSLFERTLANAQKSLAGVDTDEDKSESEAEDLEMCTIEAAVLNEGNALDTSKVSDVIHEPVAATASEEVGGVCEMCSMPDVHIWGCPIHCTYTSSLLLMHCKMQRAIARGPPGLEPPSATVSAPSSRLCSMQMS